MHGKEQWCIKSVPWVALMVDMCRRVDGKGSDHGDWIYLLGFKRPRRGEFLYFGIWCGAKPKTMNLLGNHVFKWGLDLLWLQNNEHQNELLRAEMDSEVQIDSCCWLECGSRNWCLIKVFQESNQIFFTIPDVVVDEN